MSKIDGATLMARSLKQQGVEYMFGMVGFPVGPIAEAAQKAGIPYIGMRNEQSASYAAQAVGYLTGRPGSCLVVSGPGVIHGLAGLANAQQNCWPMLLIGGASETYRNGMGAFQEERQVLIATPFCKWAHAIEHVNRIPFYVEMAVRQSIYGRPGAAYLDIAGRHHHRVDATRTRCTRPRRCPDPPRIQTMPEYIDQALNVLQSAERPLVIIGKGMAFSRAEDEVRAFIERTQLPFLASPMGKGVMPDDHPLSVGAARSLALQQADVVFLMGARFNWIMHFGLPPRYNKDVRVVQLDIAPEAMHQNKPAEVALVGDGKAIVGQLNKALDNRQWFYPKETPWRAAIAKKSAENAAQIAPQIADNSTPGGYYRLLRDVAAWVPKNAIIMQRGRQHDGYRPHPVAEFRAAARGWMPAAMARWASGWASSSPPAWCIRTGRSFVFPVTRRSASPAWRWRPRAATGLPAKIVVFNNGGIGGGHRRDPGRIAMLKMRPSVLTIGARYDMMMEAFGGKGWYIEDPKDLRGALDAAMAFPGPALVNVRLHPEAGRKPQQFGWHTS